MYRLIILISIGLLICWLGVGCSLIDQHEKTFDTIRGMGVETLKRMPIEASQVQLSGAGINPGVRFSAGVDYYIEGRYVGLSGQFGAAAQGQGDRVPLSEADHEVLRSIYLDQSITEAERSKRIMDFLNGLLDRLSPTSAPSG
jgi:hypothetical protein